MKKNVIVSLADANYFPLLEELINSIKKFKESENVAICILDAGSTQEQKEKLLKLATDALPEKNGGESSRITILSKHQNKLYEEGKIYSTIPVKLYPKYTN